METKKEKEGLSMNRVKQFLQTVSSKVKAFAAGEAVDTSEIMPLKVGAVSRFRDGIAARFAVIFSLLVLVATGTVGYMVYRGAEISLMDASTDRLKHTAEVIEVRLSASLEAISKDLRFLAATPPVQGTMRAHVGGIRSDRTYIDPETYIDDQEWLAQLANTFTVFLENRPSFVRTSFIGLINGGRELVRVEKHGQTVTRTPNAELEAKRNEAFFQRAIGLPSGDSYVSDIMLTPPADTMAGADAAPVPTIRAAMPVYASNGKVYGVVAIHVDARHVLKAATSLVDSNFNLYLANEEGTFLTRPQTSATIDDQFPAATDWFQARSDASLVTQLGATGNTSKIAYFERVQFGTPPSRHRLIVGITSPHTAILSRVSRVRNHSLLITLLFGLGGIIVALGLSGYLTRPLRQITRAVSQFGHEEDVPDEPVRLPIQRHDEIGALARTFESMAQQIRRQMHEMADKERRQRIILETSAEGIIVATEAGHIETFNEMAEDLFGYEAEMMDHAPIEWVLPMSKNSDDSEGEPESPVWKQTGSGREVIGQRKDGTTFPLSLAVSAFEISGDQKYALFLQDISERKRYEEALQQAKEQAEEIARLKSAFLANMSHEIRTPLTTVIGYASVLSREASEKHRRFARLIKSNSKRLMDTLNSVLSLARLEASGVEMQHDLLNVAEETREVTALFRPLAEKDGLALTFTPPADPEDAHAYLNRGGLSSILQNLIGNAIKFTDEGEVSVHVDVNPQNVHVHVRDTGIGIEPDFVPHLFDKFVQESTGVSRSHEGSGLGLAITKRLVESMDGQISVESEKGVGTTFTVSFPRAQVEETDEVIAPSEVDPISAPNDLPPIDILFVEDNPDTTSMVRDLLQGACDISFASNAKEALRKAKEHQYDIVLLDINLGGGPSGVDVLHKLRALPAYQHAPIAALTAYSLPGDRKRFLKMGFTSYLSKPFAPKDLYQLITDLLEPVEPAAHA